MIDVEFDIEGFLVILINKWNVIFKCGDVDLVKFIDNCGDLG